MSPPVSPEARPYRFRDGLGQRAVELSGPGRPSRWIALLIAFVLLAYVTVTAFDVLWDRASVGGWDFRARAATVGVLVVSVAVALAGRVSLGVSAAAAIVWLELHVGLYLLGPEGAAFVVLPVLVVGVGLMWGGKAAFLLAAASAVAAPGAVALGHAARGVVPWFGTTDALHQYVVGVLAMFAAATLLTLGLAVLGQRLRMSSDAERRMRDLFMGSPDGLIVADSSGRVRMVNPAARQLLDVPEAALVGHDLESALEGVIGGSAGAARLTEVVDGTRRRGTVRVGQGPSARWIEAARADVVDPDGTTGVQVSLREVTSHLEALQEHRQLGGRLEHALRMEAVGRLAGGVAHSFNNLLTVIGGCAELLLDPEEPVEGLARDILEAKVRGAALTGQLLSFAQKDVVTLSLVSLSDVVRAMKPNLESFLTEGLRLELELPAETPAVMGDRSQIEQVIMNLVINAKDAIAGVGTVTVGVYPPGAPRSWHTEEWWVPEGFVELDVEDDGVGMEEETRTRAFEPFFTTRPTGRGTGLGLSTVYGVVNQNGGEIRMLSQPGRGTSVVVRWPMASHREVA